MRVFGWLGGGRLGRKCLGQVGGGVWMEKVFRWCLYGKPGNHGLFILNIGSLTVAHPRQKRDH